MPLLKSIKIYSGRVSQLKRPIGNNQQGRASDINPIIDWINQRSDVSTAANTASGNTPILNAISGTITTASLTTAAGATTAITVTNSFCTPTSTVLAIISSTSSAGLPVIARVTPSAGSFVVSVGNGGTVALDNTVTFKFIIL